MLPFNTLFPGDIKLEHCPEVGYTVLVSLKGKP